MLISEMHVEIDLLLQKVGSYQNNNFRKEEIDIFINREIIKFIKTRLKANSNSKGEGGFDSIKRIEDLFSIVKEKTIPVFYTNDSKEVEVLLPFDFLGYIASSVYKGCEHSGNISNVIDSIYTKHTSTFSPIGNSVGGSLSSIASDFTITYTTPNATIDLFKLSTLPANYLPTDNIDSYRKFFIYNNLIYNEILRNIQGTNIEVKYNKVTNQFNIITDKAHSIIILNNENLNMYQSVAKSYPVKLILNKTLSNVRILDREFKYKMISSYLSSTKANSVIATLNDNDIKITTLNDLYYSEMVLTYVKNPVKVNLSLGVSSDLPDNSLIEIVHNVARTLKGVIGDDGYEKYVRENVLIE